MIAVDFDQSSLSAGNAASVMGSVRLLFLLLQ